MGKRKNHQPDVVDDTNGSISVHLSESSEEASLGESKCQHLSKAMNFNELCKSLKKSGIQTKCSMCETNANTSQDDNRMVECAIPTLPLWICMRCGNQACGRAEGGHAQKHYQTPRSDNHCLTIDNQNWKVYCYECDKYVDHSKDLLNKITCIKKLVGQSVIHTRPAIALPPVINTESGFVINNKIDEQLSLNNLTRVVGLMNLGNTCFFNSVLQCLAQTPYLVKVLQDLQEPGGIFILPGGLFKISSENDETVVEHTLPPIEGTLDGWGSFTSILHKTLIEMQNSTENKTYRPSELLHAFKKNNSQCMDGGQHDSHELLRHLLELVRSEDVKRYQSVILEKTGLKGKKRQDLNPLQKEQVKCYGNQASDRLLGPERVFRGELVSTLQCYDCKHTSQRTEPFLDLSLPVVVEKSQPPISKRKNCGVDDNPELMNINVPANPSPSKHQLKKGKKFARKNRIMRRHRGSTSNSNKEESLLSNNSILEENQEGVPLSDWEPSDESDADVEDNTEGEAAPPDVIEPEYSSETLVILSPTDLTANPLNNLSKTFSEAETDECRSSPEAEHPIDGSSIVANVDGIDEVTGELSEMSVKKNRTVTSPPPRYPHVEGEFSIQSCLNQFTTSELMTGSNKVGCEICTARANKGNPDSNPNAKMICTPSIKQYLISRVPPVLILHLKRFQSQRYGGFHKVNKHVTFPMILDLAPVCKNHKKPKLYSLFGLVEHYGHLHYGHYVAYVKARQPLDPNDRRWSFLPKKGAANGNDENKSSNDSDNESEEDQEPKTTLEPQPGHWFRVSDSSVNPVNEATVLKAEAYLLFYERIL